MSEKVGPEHYGAELVEAAEAKAERLVREELKRAGWTEKDLGKRSKGDAVKVEIAMRLRRETTMAVGWIAGRLGMGSRDAVNNLLCRKRKEKHNVRD